MASLPLGVLALDVWMGVPCPVADGYLHVRAWRRFSFCIDGTAPVRQGMESNTSLYPCRIRLGVTRLSELGIKGSMLLYRIRFANYIRRALLLKPAK